MQYGSSLKTTFEEIIVELSYNCNLSCAMCGFGKESNPFNKRKFLNFDNYKTILYQIGNLTKTIRLNGRGESTIHPEFIKILDYTKLNYPSSVINLFSNFSFSSPKILEALIRNQVQLFISLDSPIENELLQIRKGAKFNFIKENIKLLKDIQNRPFIIFTIQELNIHRIYEIAKFAYDHDCHILFNTIRRDEGIENFISTVKEKSPSIKEQFEKVYKLYQHSELMCLYPDQLAGITITVRNKTQTHGTMKSCPALQKELCILHDGTITPCNMFNPYVYGNIFKQSLGQIWHGESRLSFLKTHKTHYYCINCANLGM